MGAILYLETNYLMGIATGSYDATQLLESASPSLTLAMPKCCLMEAFAAEEQRSAHRRRFSRTLDRRMRQLKRQLRIERVREVVTKIEAAKLENDRLITDLRERLLKSIEQLLAANMELIDETAELISRAVSRPSMVQITDSLVLEAILEHADSRPGLDKRFFTEDRRGFGDSAILARLREKGIGLITRHEDVMAWARHRT